MLGHGTKFGHKKEQAIAALLSHRSVEAAAGAVGINANTLPRWIKEPEFAAAYEEARVTVFSQSIGRLQVASGAAVSTVLKIMLDPNVPAGSRLRAAEVVLERAARADQMEDIEDRVAKLERTAGLARKSRKRSADLTWLSVTPSPCPTTTRGQIAAPPLVSTENNEDVIE
jgi:hypothetical protein